MSTTSIEAKLDDITKRLMRIETRVINGFESIGVDTYERKDWLTLDEVTHTIYVSSMGRSIQVINDVAKKQGAVVGKVYEVVWRGGVRATLEIY